MFGHAPIVHVHNTCGYTMCDSMIEMEALVSLFLVDQIN